ncbi:hypothetical protein MKZ38_005378 [Zalerion maritima]|uniref:Uncharacterized protein n=1 Tax=Zalerion maritima TaxID=339359 RepID=A0AAD5WW80_9PEZI|nr:hypothetical protein MKZ38_005378 [Zalerion maritima]
MSQAWICIPWIATCAKFLLDTGTLLILFTALNLKESTDHGYQRMHRFGHETDGQEYHLETAGTMPPKTIDLKKLVSMVQSPGLQGDVVMNLLDSLISELGISESYIVSTKTVSESTKEERECLSP